MKRMNSNVFCGGHPFSVVAALRLGRAHTVPMDPVTTDLEWVVGLDMGRCVDPADWPEDPFLPNPAHSAFPHGRRDLGFLGQWFWNPPTSFPRDFWRTEEGIVTIYPWRQMCLNLEARVLDLGQQCSAQTKGTADFDWRFLGFRGPSLRIQCKSYSFITEKTKTNKNPCT